MQLSQNATRTALYLRLSRDEDLKGESHSITNQRHILAEYAEAQGFSIVEEYIDDGFSGANFNRPGFIQMLEDAKAKRFDILLVKDLSRLGRDYIGTGEHIEKIFPALGIRFISMAEGYDSLLDDEPSSDMIPFLNMFNEFHSKQTSRKTKASKMSMAKAGKYMGNKAPFGYIRDPDDKYHLIIDPEAAETVKLIFQYACEGHGYKSIARRLREQNRLNPTAYTNEKFPEHHKSEYWKQPHDWHATSVKNILHDLIYRGHVVNGRRRVTSFKTKEVVKMPKESWIIVEDTHEAIITQDVWNRAHEKITVRKRNDNHGAQQMFAGLAKCSDCGYNMNYSSNQGNPRYRCSLYSTKGKDYCKSHYITYDDLCEVVLADIRRRAKLASRMDAQILNSLEERTSKVLRQQERQMEQSCAKLEKRMEELDTIIQKIYEDSVLGRIPQERADTMLEGFEEEQRSLKPRLDALKESCAESKSKNNELTLVVDLFAKYKDLKELTVGILNELVQEIRIGDKETVNGEKRQTIQIVYYHQCYVDYFEESPKQRKQSILKDFQENGPLLFGDKYEEYYEKIFGEMLAQK